MMKKIKAFLAVAALSGTVGANVQAAEVTVQNGDTLWDISQVHNTSVENIQNWNHLSTDLIHPGDVLTIATEKQYTVQQDETLVDIALKFQVSVKQIKEWNKLNTDQIHPGLNLIIYDELPDQVKNTQSTDSNEENTEANNLEKPVVKSVVTSPETNSTTNKEQTSTAQSSKPVPAVQPAKPAPVAQSVKPVSTAKPAETANNNSKEITVKATAYTASCEGCSGTTATGVDLKANPNAKVIAVDPSVIPLGSKVYVEGYGVATAADTGGAIKGNRIDVFISSEQEALKFGKKEISVKILD